MEVYPASQSVPRQGSLGIAGAGPGGMAQVGGQQQVYQTHIFAPPVTGAPVKKAKYGSAGSGGESSFDFSLYFFFVFLVERPVVFRPRRHRLRGVPFTAFSSSLRSLLAPFIVPPSFHLFRFFGPLRSSLTQAD